MIKYYKLFNLLKRRNMKKTDLLKVISSPTLAKLSKNETVRSDIIDKLCTFLKVQPNEIMECLIEQTIYDENNKPYSVLLPVDYNSMFEKECTETDLIYGHSIYIKDQDGHTLSDEELNKLEKNTLNDEKFS